MNQNELADLVEQSEIHRLILGDTCGPYSLGITRVPGTDNGYGFLLKVAEPRCLPPFIMIRGERIPVVVQRGFQAPLPLQS